MNSAEALRQAAELLVAGDYEGAREALSLAFPPPPQSNLKGSWSKKRLVRVFIRDGFTDRYFGQHLVYPGALRTLSILAPALFPYHPHWKQDSTHPAYWTHYPTIDHVHPVARGGADDESNVVTTSMLRNSVKGNWLLSELGWPEPPSPPVSNWDGLLPWFCSEYERNSDLRAHPVLQAWYRAARNSA